MRSRHLLIGLALACAVASNSFAETVARTSNRVLAQNPNDPKLAANPSATNPESAANTLAVPNKILATGSDIHSHTLSANAVELAKQLGVWEQIHELRKLREKSGYPSTLEERMSLLELRRNISETLQHAETDINYVMAEIFDEQGIYTELSSSYASARDKKIARTNMIAFGTNGVFWAIGEAYDVPAYAHPNYSVASGIFGILGGIVPSIASAYTLHEIAGGKYDEPAKPNSLTPIFDRSYPEELRYPDTVYNFLTSAPSDMPDKTRRQLIVDRWVSDKNIPQLTDRGSGSQIDDITGAVSKKKKVTIGLLGARNAMLSQLTAEIFKMNRLLDELEMALRGNKSV